MESFQSAQSTTLSVAHLVISLDNGGLEHLVMRWTAHRNQHSQGSTHIICLDERGVLADDFQGGPVHCIEADRAQFPWDRAAVKRLSNLLAELKIGVVHSHNVAANQYAVLATRKTGIPVLHTQHGVIKLDDQGWKAVVRNRILSLFTQQYVAVSKEVARDIGRTHGISPDKVRFIANGVGEHQPASSDYLEQLRQSHNIPSRSFVLGSIGRLADVKGWDLFLPVFAEIAQKYVGDKPLHLLLVGDGPELNLLQSMIKDLGIERQITFAGYQADCHAYYELMDVFLMPSRNEGLSVSLLEAMQAGCPVAVTAVGEHTKLIETSQGGILLTPSQPESWGQALLDFLSNEEQRECCATRGQAHIKAHYTLEKTCHAYEAMYHNLKK